MPVLLQSPELQSFLGPRGIKLEEVAKSAQGSPVGLNGNGSMSFMIDANGQTYRVTFPKDTVEDWMKLPRDKLKPVIRLELKGVSDRLIHKVEEPVGTGGPTFLEHLGAGITPVLRPTEEKHVAPININRRIQMIIDQLEKARTSKEIREALPRDEELKLEVLSNLTPSQRGKLLAILTPAERKELEILPLAVEIRTLPSLTPYFMGSDIGFIISGMDCLNFQVPRDLIIKKKYREILGFLSRKIESAITEEQAQLPEDKRMSGDQTSSTVKSITELIGISQVTANADDILSKIRTADAEASSQALSSRSWIFNGNIYVKKGGEEKSYAVSIAVSYAEIINKTPAQISEIVSTKIDNALSTSIPDSRKRKIEVNIFMRSSNIKEYLRVLNSSSKEK
ncbi:MAG: hypothetical protein ABII22_03875 [Candidatus Micrarchaeota archaeon]